MRNILTILCMVSACSASLFPVQTVDNGAFNICVFTTDPNKYLPKCFLCPQTVYKFTLQACVNGTSMPSNITYDSANCIEKNCEINYPTVKPSAGVDKVNFLEMLGKILSGKSIYKRSIEDNKIEQMYEEAITRAGHSGWKIVGNIETLACDLELEELDYTT